MDPIHKFLSNSIIDGKDKKMRLKSIQNHTKKNLTFQRLKGLGWDQRFTKKPHTERWSQPIPKISAL